jgi:hypothetical protein
MDGRAKTWYLAECFWPGADVAALDAVGGDARAAAARTAGTAHEVRYLGSLFMPSDEVVFYLFEGPSADAVEAVARAAGVPFERVVPSVLVTIEGKGGTR